MLRLGSIILAANVSDWRGARRFFHAVNADTGGWILRVVAVGPIYLTFARARAAHSQREER